LHDNFLHKNAPIVVILAFAPQPLGFASAEAFAKPYAGMTITLFNAES
jgi:hypothetical protein